MPKTQKQQVSSFISTIARMPAGSQVLCALIVYPTKSSTDLETLKKQIQQEKTITLEEFTYLPALEKIVSDNTATQTLKTPQPVICLISEKDFAQNTFDALSPLVFRLAQSANLPSHD